MPFEATISAFAAALGEPSAAPPAMTRGRLGAPDARRFSVYRNNVAVGLIGALEARYPVSRRIAGDDAFRALARAFVRAQKAALASHDRLRRGFPGVRRGVMPGAEPCLADVARLENAWVEAYHAEDAPAATIGELAELSPDCLPGTPDRVSPRRPASAVFDPRRLDLGLAPRRRRPRCAGPGDG